MLNKINKDEVIAKDVNIKSVYIKTYGCQMNVYDSERMVELLKPHGFNCTTSPENADLVILNTCHIREKASEKVHSELGRIALIKKDKRQKYDSEMIVVVGGCVGQAEGENIIARSPCVDIVVGPQSYHNLPELIERVKREKSWAVDLDFYENDKFDSVTFETMHNKHSSFLSIQEGCDKFCHFCVVPYTRGAEFSRPFSAIYREAIGLVSHGCKEITLLGQNVSAYHGLDDQGNEITIGKLIKLLAKIDGLQRIRYTTSHPNDMLDSDLLDAHASIDKLMPYIHLPVQSGSDKILQSMNRKHKRDFYFDLIEKFRSVRPDIAFSSDFIVGYPGETEEDFDHTMSLVQQVNYAQAYSFKYSPRPGTPASALKNQVTEKDKDDRLQRLQKLLYRQQKDFNQSKIGERLTVLLEKHGKYDGQLVGKSEYMQSVIVENPQLKIGDIVNVIITNATQNSLHGKIISNIM
jgi:tRNA-2-methylthio-N6-dimethylallyladenosine synthase